MLLKARGAGSGCLPRCCAGAQGKRYLPQPHALRPTLRPPGTPRCSRKSGERHEAWGEGQGRKIPCFSGGDRGEFGARVEQNPQADLTNGRNSPSLNFGGEDHATRCKSARARSGQRQDFSPPSRSGTLPSPMESRRRMAPKTMGVVLAKPSA